MQSNMSTPTPTPTPLFGGAITALLPPELIDVSNLRQVPDNQEVWVDSTANQSASLIIELLHLDPQVSSEALATFHLSQVLLAASDDDDNSEPQYELLDASSLPDASCALSHSGFPIIAKRVVAQVGHLHKFNQSANTHPVLLMVWVLRVPHVETDIVVTWNLPEGVLSPGIPGAPTTLARPPVRLGGLDKALVDRCEVVARSLKVVDWGLFC
ncbi:hypothetical protein BCR44DRAFT_39052 [Catenaria anguillulae PL171]|uniref:Mog1p/PsbP-like protein n=1 Tax=Catenaria anguillulae PL171 TaxID=765915 RepID=A0A1Y2HCX3_9FUNG|nr:hypothetical protein BCR44DRAFT_39052 [Catenaria anguillulae PL171]